MSALNQQPYRGEIAAEPLAIEWPNLVDAFDFLSNPPDEPNPLIEGVLNRGEKMLLGGPAKIGKTWLALDLGTAVATGTPWLGFPTREAKVLFINLELSEWAMHQRLHWILRSKELELKESQMIVWNLRGIRAEIGALAGKLIETLPNDLGLIIPDPIYKTLGDLDENAAGHIASLFGHVDRIGKATGAAMLITHHFAKGAGARAQIDQFSGSSVWVRDPDVLGNIQPHQEKEKLVMSLTIRNGKSPDPIGLDATFPVMKRNNNLDIKLVESAQNKRVPQGFPELSAFMEIFPTAYTIDAPKKALLTAGQIRRKMAERHWKATNYRASIDDAIGEGLLAETKGSLPNQKFFGLPEIVAAYEAHNASPPLVPDTRKKRAMPIANHRKTSRLRNR